MFAAFRGNIRSLIARPSGRQLLAMPTRSLEKAATRSFYNLYMVAGNFIVNPDDADIAMEMTGQEIVECCQGEVLNVAYGGVRRVIHVFGTSGFILNSENVTEQTEVERLRTKAEEQFEFYVAGKGSPKGAGTASVSLYPCGVYKEHVTDTLVVISFADSLYNITETRCATSKIAPNPLTEQLKNLDEGGVLPVHPHNFPDTLKRNYEGKNTTRHVAAFSVPGVRGKDEDGNKTLETEEPDEDPQYFRKKDKGSANGGTCAIVNATFHKPLGDPIFVFSSGEFQPLKMGDTKFKAKDVEMTGKGSEIFEDAIMHSCATCSDAGEYSAEVTRDWMGVKVLKKKKEKKKKGKK